MIYPSYDIESIRVTIGYDKQSSSVYNSYATPSIMNSYLRSLIIIIIVYVKMSLVSFGISFLSPSSVFVCIKQVNIRNR